MRFRLLLAIVFATQLACDLIATRAAAPHLPVRCVSRELPRACFEPCAFAIKRITADYLRPARVDEVLEVHTHPGNHTRASVVLNQTILRDGTPLFRLEPQVVLIALSGRLLRFPASLAEHLLANLASL